MGTYQFKLPDIGEGIAEAEIVAWHVKVGDTVEEDQQLADMMTDKATVEMESPVSGTVVSLAGEVGDQIPIGSTLVVIETAGEVSAESETKIDEVAEEIERRDHPRGGGPRVEALFKKIHAKGWLGITYPKEYGGQGGDRISQYIVEEEFLRVGIPVGLGGSGAPAIMAAGPASPPMASIAMRGPPFMGKASLGLGRDDFAAVIVAASAAHVVRQLQFAAVRALLELGRLERMMAAAHVPLRRRGFSLGDSHCGTFN